MYDRSMKSLLIVAALSLTGCMFHNVHTNTALDRTVCPDPPPVHPGAIIGSTPCVVLPEKLVYGGAINCTQSDGCSTTARKP